jgi:hypothetical protein
MVIQSNNMVRSPLVALVITSIAFVFADTVQVAAQDGRAELPKRAEFSVPVKIVPDNESVEREAEERLADERHNALDLDAQNRSAEAAEKAAAMAQAQVLIGWLQFGFSAVGSIGLVATLVLTWSSARSAAAAAKAALAANKLAQQNFALDQRPWIRLERPEIKLVEHRGTSAIQFSVDVSNVGKTPARDTELHLDVSFGNLVPPSIEGVETYAQSVAKPGTWRNWMKIVFPNAARPLNDAIILDKLPSSDQSCRIRYCVNYRGASAEAIYHTAGEVTFPMSRLITYSNSQKGEMKYNFHGTSSVA